MPSLNWEVKRNSVRYLQRNDHSVPVYFYNGAHQPSFIIHTKLRLYISDLNQELVNRQASFRFGAVSETVEHYHLSFTAYSTLKHVTTPSRHFPRITLSYLYIERKLQALVYDILPSTTAVFSYVIGSRKLSANEQFFFGAQTVVSLLQTIQIKQGVSFIAANKVDTGTNKTTIVWIESDSFFYRGGCVSCLRACFSARLLLQSYLVLEPFEGADHVGGQLRGDTECPFSGVTKSGRVWRKVPESGARSMLLALIPHTFHAFCSGSSDAYRLCCLGLAVWSLLLQNVAPRPWESIRLIIRPRGAEDGHLDFHTPPEVGSELL